MTYCSQEVSWVLNNIISNANEFIDPRIRLLDIIISSARYNYRVFDIIIVKKHILSAEDTLL